MILTGEKLPGSRLILADLEKELGIGRGPIREALMRLDRSGLVRNVPYKGAVVAHPPKFQEMETIYRVRVELEIELALEAMHRFTRSDFDRLEKVLEKLMTVEQTNETFFSLDRQFHSVINEVSGLTHLCLIVNKLLDSIGAFLNLHRYDINDCSKFNHEHGVIIQALRNKDEPTLRRVLESNIMGGLDLVKGAYSQILHKESA